MLFWVANEIPYTLNYFGNPKIIFDNGDVMDIWSLPTGKTILEHLEDFSFLNDSLALNISSGTLIELKNSTRYTKKKILQVNKKWLCSATESDRAYASLKSLYLLLRHDMKPSSSIVNLISANYLITSLLRKNSIKLAKELFIISEASNLNCKMKKLATDFVLGNSANLLAELITDKAFKRK
ncbi:hypothetical protein [Psychromonas algicola]|uniref:hypothetical protein n=1 Tax=Psychromonas algicola TaxID=2555642 RepID=UPI0010673B4D|nr:hypothetical protein [Psychromonas sp. RZ5]TEW43609.1 hypothetical protein E2R67_15695 [Psychromonas sp. RZ5]